MNSKTEPKYIFWIIPDLADQPQTYLIYRDDDRSAPIAHVSFQNRDYQVSGDKDLTITEQLQVLQACDKFLRERFFPQVDEE